MRRREFIAGLGGAAAWPVMGLAQPVPIVGFLSNTPPDAQGNARFVAAFRRGLRDAGYLDDRNVIIDFQSTNNQIDRLDGLAKGLADRGTAVIVTAGGHPAIEVAKVAEVGLVVGINK